MRADRAFATRIFSRGGPVGRRPANPFIMSTQYNTAIDPEEAASAFFESSAAADKAEANLKKAGFSEEMIYVVPRAPGLTVTVADSGRVAEATKILQDAGGELREADINASGSVMFRLSPTDAAPAESPDEIAARSRRTEDEDGAGAATGGAIF